MHPNWQEICHDFIEATSYKQGDLEKEWYLKVDQSKKPSGYLEYHHALEIIPLGTPEFTGTSPAIWELLQNRRSKRKYIDESISLQELNLLLWGTQGITADMGDYQLRTTPSAGALYPIETYLLIHNVEGLNKGLYHLNVKKWALEAIKYEDTSEFAYMVTENQATAKNSAVTFIWTALIDRTLYKYKERTYRYIYQDVGHVSQNLHLAGNALNLGVCTMGHWYDQELHEYIGIDGKKHLSVLLAAVGKVQGEDWKEDRRA